MHWNWQHKNWPVFEYDASALSEMEAQFLHGAGELSGAIKHMDYKERNNLTVELISTEAIKTSEIEGEILNRDSVQSSIRRNFGLDSDDRHIPPAERGIAEMMTDLYRTYDAPLSNAKLFEWHKMLTSGRRDLSDIGRYRTHKDAMQVVSGSLHKPNIHFEAPPSAIMDLEMNRFIAWFNDSSPRGSKPMPALLRSGLAHLWFVCIHPFEDGNGRIGRAVCEKALSQNLGQPTLLSLSQTIQNARKVYYQSLEDNNKHLEITAWLLYFAQTALDAQKQSQALIDFLIAKVRFMIVCAASLIPDRKRLFPECSEKGQRVLKAG